MSKIISDMEMSEILDVFKNKIKMHLMVDNDWHNIRKLVNICELFEDWAGEA